MAQAALMNRRTVALSVGGWSSAALLMMRCCLQQVDGIQQNLIERLDGQDQHFLARLVFQLLSNTPSHPLGS
jgi:hypothetical protein